MPQIKTSNGTTMTVSQEAWNSVYSKYPQKYTLVQEQQAQPNRPVTDSGTINSLYQKYFKRNATQAEIDNWSKEPSSSLDSFLQQEQVKYGIKPATPSTPPATPAPTGKRQIYRIGTDIYDASTNQKIGATDWANNWSGKSDVVEIAAPTQAGTQSETQGGTTQGTTQPEINPADQKWVNDLYQKYFDRNATSAELSNWTKESPASLEQFLTNEATKYNYRSKYFQSEDNTRLTEALKVIDASDLPPDIKEMWKTVVNGYPKGVEYDTAEILATFNKVKQDTIDPYFKQLADTAISDIRSNMTQLEQTRAQELEAERSNAGLNIRQAKEGLEKSGMTFTGKAVETLGAQSAYAQPGAGDTSTIPAQTPFGGMFYEGTVNQGNRLMASSSELRNKATQEAIARNAENLLGTAGAQGLGINQGLAGTVGTGSLEVQKQGQYASTLQQLVENYRQKQAALTNKTY